VRRPAASQDGCFYDDFQQVTDDYVSELLAQRWEGNASHHWEVSPRFSHLISQAVSACCLRVYGEGGKNNVREFVS
jgi:hypothetical protein